MVPWLRLGGLFSGLKVKTLLCVFANRHDATSFYRGAGPFGCLQVDGWQIRFTDTLSWAELMGVDCVFFQRPESEEQLQAIAMARNLNIAVWVDYDDNLYNVPFSNPYFERYADPALHKRVQHCVAMASVVTVSTATLAAAYRKDAQVIPNAVNDRHMPFEYVTDPTKTVVWRGSATHNEDVLSQQTDIVRLQAAYRDYRWVFIGGLPWQLAAQVNWEQTEVIPSVSLVTYFGLLKRLKPSWVIAPLVDSPFNRGKSNIAWLEATWCGATCIGPDLPEWQRPGLVNYVDSLFDAFSVGCDVHYDRSFQYIDEHLRLSVVNKQRANILRGL